MNEKGRITVWNDEKGYGFIAPLKEDDDRVFFHIKAFANRTRRPKVGDVVIYCAAADSRGRPRAEHVAKAGIQQRDRSRVPRLLPHVVALGFLIVVAGSVQVTTIPVAVLYFYMAVSLLTFSIYAFDKSAAKRGAWRTSENSLHVLSLVGGWPGALVAQTNLRHKSKKQPFRTIFWVTVLINCVCFVSLFTPKGTSVLHTILQSVTSKASFF